jgi:hypothetical protein
MAATLPVVWRQRPFVGPVHKRTIDAAVRIPTIAEIIGAIATNELPRGFAEIGEVRINGAPVPRGLWHLVRPRWRPDRDTVVSLHIPLGGPPRGGSSSSGSSSGGGGKQTLTSVAEIALLLAAVVISAGGLGPGGLALLGPSFAAGGSGAIIASTAIGIGSALAIAALTPRPSLSAPAAGPALPGAGSQPVPSSLTGNALSPGDSIPRVIGTMRLFPPLACNPLIEIVGDLEYAEAVFVLAGPHALSSSQVGGTTTASIAEVDEQLVEGKNGDPIQTMVQRYSFTTDVNAQLGATLLDPTTQYRLLDQSNPAIDLAAATACESRRAPDEIWINLAWAGGLYDSANAAMIVNQAARVQIKRHSDTAWINLPEVHFSMNAPDAFQKAIRIKWGAIPIGQSTPPTNQGPVYAFKHVPGQNGSTITPATAGWTADASFSAGSGSDVLDNATFLAGTSNVRNTELYADKVIFYLDPAAFPQDDYYDIEVTASSAYNSAGFVASTYEYLGGTVQDFFEYYLSGAFYIIPQDPTSINSTVQLTRLSSVWNQNPIQSFDFATMSVRVHSRSLDQYSILASGYTFDWDGTGWNTLTTTDNPAPHARDVLAGSLGAKPVPASLINDAEFVAWRTDANTRGLTVNAVVQNNKIMDVLNMIAGCTRANIRHNEKWGAFLDKDVTADAPIQIFTPRNMANFSWTRAYADNPSGILANYIDADFNYDTSAEAIVYANPAVQNADLLSQQTYDGLVHLADIQAQATFDLRQLLYRFTFYQFDVSADALVAERGDLIGVQHDILTRRAGSSRIVSVIKSGSNITGLTLDGSVPVWTTAGISTLAHVASASSIQALGEKTGCAIRLKQGAGILTKQVTTAANGDNVDVTFATPFADPGNIDTDCLVSVGPFGSEYKRVIVYGVQPTADLQATVTCVDEAPQLWQ